MNAAIAAGRRVLASRRNSFQPLPDWNSLSARIFSTVVARMTDLVARAREFAIREHRRIDHRRKYSKQPYDVHLETVADLVAGVTDDAEMIAAAWLHDIVEDTPITLDDVARELGGAVARLVDELTDVSRPGDGNRAARKAIDRAHLAAASPRAKTIKLADLTDNARDICRHDAGFGRVYLGEMEALLAVLGEGDPALMAKARKTLAHWLAQVRSAEAGASEPRRQTRWQDDEVRSAWKLLNTFSVADLAQPLTSVDASRLAAEQIIDGSAPISVMVHMLTRYENAFVRTADRITGVLSRADLEKPIGRMWLFGIVTLVEFDFIRRIRARWPDQGWTALLSAGRLDKARELQEERARRGQPADLLDCLQLADKGSILVHDPEVLRDWGYRSKQSAKAALQDIQSLRNHLAHSQAIVAHHWHQIAGLSRRLDDWMLENAGSIVDLPR